MDNEPELKVMSEYPPGYDVNKQVTSSYWMCDCGHLLSILSNGEAWLKKADVVLGRDSTDWVKCPVCGKWNEWRVM